MISSMAAAVLATSAMVAPMQDGAGWTLREGPELSMAALGTLSGAVIAVRCSGRQLDVLIGGLPPVPPDAESRLMVFERDGPRGYAETWTPAEQGVRYAGRPAYYARNLRHGGRLAVREPKFDHPDGVELLTAEIPEDSGVVDRVLEDCGTPLENARDALEVVELLPDATGVTPSIWERLGQAQWPQAAQSAGVRVGWAITSCIVTEAGRLRDCEVEMESPIGAGFGDSARRGMSSARLRLGETTRPGMLLVSRTRFRLSK